jgi:hypothetical protein
MSTDYILNRATPSRTPDLRSEESGTCRIRPAGRWKFGLTEVIVGARPDLFTTLQGGDDRKLVENLRVGSPTDEGRIE